jgi:hypothetical protein
MEKLTQHVDDVEKGSKAAVADLEDQLYRSSITYSVIVYWTSHSANQNTLGYALFNLPASSCREWGNLEILIVSTNASQLLHPCLHFASATRIRLLRIPEHENVCAALNFAAGQAFGGTFERYSSFSHSDQPLTRSPAANLIFLSENIVMEQHGSGNVLDLIQKSVAEPLFASSRTGISVPIVTDDGISIKSAGLDFRWHRTATGKAGWIAVPRFAGYSVHTEFSLPVARIAPSEYAFALSRSVFREHGGFFEPTCASLALAVVDLALRLGPGSTTVAPNMVVRIETLSHGSHVQPLSLPSEWQSKVIAPERLNVSVVWDLYCGCTGWNIEVANFAVSLEPFLDLNLIAGQGCFCPGFPSSFSSALSRMSVGNGDIIEAVDVFISHKPPKSYPRFPYNGNVVIRTRPPVVIGRSMTGMESHHVLLR